MSEKIKTTTATVRKDTMKRIKIAALEMDLSIVDYIDYLIEKELGKNAKGRNSGNNNHESEL